jgi:hypothetical protein
MKDFFAVALFLFLRGTIDLHSENVNSDVSVPQKSVLTAKFCAKVNPRSVIVDFCIGIFCTDEDADS